MNDRKGKTGRLWTAIAFIATIVTVGAFNVFRRDSSDFERMAHIVATTHVRSVESRLSRFPYGRYEAGTRPGSTTQMQRQLRGAAATIALNRGAARDVHTSAIANLLAGQLRVAVNLLEALVRTDPSNAAVWSDLSAARYEIATVDDDVAGFISAVSAADSALRLRPSSEEAAFNRALAWDAAHEVQSAERAYRHFLELSSSSEWSQEARERLRNLQASKRAGTWKASLPKIELAVQQGNRERVAQFVSQFPEESRSWTEVEFLGLWANAEAKGDRAEAERYLSLARQLAGALSVTNDEHLPADAVSSIDRATTTARNELIHAHREYHEGRRLYSQRLLSEAAPLLDRAILHFRGGASPMAAVAAYYAANLAVDASRTSDALVLAAVATKGTSSRYRALNAELEWLRGTMEGRDGHLFESLRAYLSAANSFEALGEIDNSSYMKTSAATVLTRLGRDAEAWRAKRDAWNYFGVTEDSRSLQIALIAAADGEIIQSRFDSARALLNAALDLSKEAQNPRAESTALVWRALCGIRVPSTNVALELSIARQRAEGLKDRDLRADALDRIRIADATATDNADLAARLLTESIDFARQHGQLLNVPHLFLQRGRRKVELGDLRGAIGDFRQAAASVELRRSEVVEDGLRDSYFGTARDIYSDLADALQRSGLVAEAFEATERRRARVILDRKLSEYNGAGGILTLSELQRRLPKSITLIEFIAARDHLLRFRLNQSGLVCDVVQLSPARLGTLVDELREAIEREDVTTARRNGESLYDAVLGSVARNLTSRDRLMIVADDALERLPFGALFDRSAQQYLVEQVPFVMAPSANLLARGVTLESSFDDDAIMIADPEIDEVAFPHLARLPGAAAAGARLHAHNPAARVLTGSNATVRTVLSGANASALYFATHAMLNDREPSQSCLVLAPEGSSSGALYLQEIARLHLARAHLVMLAGCRTGVVASGGHGDVRSLAAAFLMAGARTVIASLWDVEDEATQELSDQVRLNRRQQRSAAVALQNAQKTMLHSTNPRFKTLRAWAGFEIYGND